MKKILRSIFIMGIVLIFSVISMSYVFSKKWNYMDDNAATEIMKGYYDEPDNTLDIIYLGFSAVRNGISSLEIWNEYGYTGYSRASSIQPPIVSYWLLEETFQHQSPKVVFYEASGLCNVTAESLNDYEENEGKLHEVVDNMPWSVPKIKMINSICENSELSFLSLASPLYRYHDRWEELTKEDFALSSDNHYAYKGQYPAITTTAYEYPEGSFDVISEEPLAIDDTTAYCVELMKQLCEQNGAELVLLKMPTVTWTNEKHHLIRQYAEEKGLKFLDYAVQDTMEAVNLNTKTDFKDYGAHLNVNGATKVSKSLGEFLSDNYELTDKRGKTGYEQWDLDYQRYEREWKAYELTKCSDIFSYIDMLSDEDYLVAVTSRYDTSTYFTEEIYEQMKTLGLEVDHSRYPFNSYVALVDGGEAVYEEVSVSQRVEYQTVLDGVDIYLMSESDRLSESYMNISINDTLEAETRSGLNFVVYDKTLGRVIDSKAFNTGKTGRLYTRG
ncbi:MAG: hypothetical protein NC081_01575 [Roseburia sp.]|nr:hypothetical protein [Roseburia sp.]